MNPAPSPDECRRLWAAVLWNARNDLRDRRPNGDSKANRASALSWIKGRGDGVGSFVFVCEVLNLSPAKVREGLIKAGGLS